MKQKNTQDKRTYQRLKHHTSGPQAEHQILKERARQLAAVREEDIEAGGSYQLLSFSVGEERFGLEIHWVKEIQPLQSTLWSRVPCAPDFILGAVNIRGRIYSMMNVPVFLGVQVDPVLDQAHALLVRGFSRAEQDVLELCLVADALPDLVSIPLSAVQPAEAALSLRMQQYIKGVTQDMLVILDLEKLLADPAIIVDEEAE